MIEKERTMPAKKGLFRILPAAVSMLVLGLTPRLSNATPVYHSCPQQIDSSAIIALGIDDFTEHTYSVRAGSVGSFASCTITRTFSAPIDSITVTIEAGQADDIGFVAGILVTDVNSQCSGLGRVTIPVDVTSVVSTNENRATLTLKAQENCCCTTGWGEDTSPGRLNAKLHWKVMLKPTPVLKAKWKAALAKASTELGIQAAGSAFVATLSPFLPKGFALLSAVTGFRPRFFANFPRTPQTLITRSLLNLSYHHCLF